MSAGWPGARGLTQEQELPRPEELCDFTPCTVNSPGSRPHACTHACMHAHTCTHKHLLPLTQSRPPSWQKKAPAPGRHQQSHTEPDTKMGRDCAKQKPPKSKTLRLALTRCPHNTKNHLLKAWASYKCANISNSYRECTPQHRRCTHVISNPARQVELHSL